MIQFKEPTLEDKNWVKKAMQENGTNACEFCFGNLFMWSYIYHNKIANFQGMLLAMDEEEKNIPAYLYPCGKGDKKAAISLLFDLAKQKNIPLIMYCLTEENVKELEMFFPNQFAYEPIRDDFDYIYETEAMANLAGRKYHGKRNHIAYFKKTYDWAYEPITEENISECQQMAQQWKEENLSKNPEEIENEYEALLRGLQQFFALDFEGGLLRVDGKVVAFTFGEAISETTFCTHVEKAFAEIRGAYPTIHQEFTKHALLKYKYVNREEDTGSEGLRHAKESYYPCILLQKFKAIYKG